MIELCWLPLCMFRSDIVVVGAGAAGCFAAIQAAHYNPNLKIVILEKSKQALAKVKVSGGGRCNVTNVLSDPTELSKKYPRGERFLKKAFYQFSSKDMVAWLAQKGVKLKLYPDGCYFPESNESQTIIDCFLTELKLADIQIHLQQGVQEIELLQDGFHVHTSAGVWKTKRVIVSSGGHPKITGFDYLKSLNIPLIDPVPSLFTFNLPEHPIRELMGIVQQDAQVRIAGYKWNPGGPLLITHWGLSGPAILVASAFGARDLAAVAYEKDFHVNWTGGLTLNETLDELRQNKTSRKLVRNVPHFDMKSRLWEFLVSKAGIDPERTWEQCSEKQLLRLAEVLAVGHFHMSGKTTFKEEFVTAGGVDLNTVDVQTMQSKLVSGLYFAGEVLDIDGITGGFNFQAAWTTGFIAGKHVGFGL
jgi:predicted Rossmann fold flavoprotein